MVIESTSFGVGVSSFLAHILGALLNFIKYSKYSLFSPVFLPHQDRKSFDI